MDIFKRVSRLEVIGRDGRILTLYDLAGVSTSLQDDEQTLKVFIKEKPAIYPEKRNRS